MPACYIQTQESIFIIFLMLKFNKQVDQEQQGLEEGEISDDDNLQVPPSTAPPRSQTKHIPHQQQQDSPEYVVEQVKIKAPSPPPDRKKERKDQRPDEKTLRYDKKFRVSHSPEGYYQPPQPQQPMSYYNYPPSGQPPYTQPVMDPRQGRYPNQAMPPQVNMGYQPNQYQQRQTMQGQWNPQIGISPNKSGMHSGYGYQMGNNYQNSYQAQGPNSYYKSPPNQVSSYQGQYHQPQGPYNTSPSQFHQYPNQQTQPQPQSYAPYSQSQPNPYAQHIQHQHPHSHQHAHQNQHQHQHSQQFSHSQYNQSYTNQQHQQKLLLQRKKQQQQQERIKQKNRKIKNIQAKIINIAIESKQNKIQNKDKLESRDKNQEKQKDGKVETNKEANTEDEQSLKIKVSQILRIVKRIVKLQNIEGNAQGQTFVQQLHQKINQYKLNKRIQEILSVLQLHRLLEKLKQKELQNSLIQEKTRDQARQIYKIIGIKNQVSPTPQPSQLLNSSRKDPRLSRQIFH